RAVPKLTLVAYTTLFRSKKSEEKRDEEAGNGRKAPSETLFRGCGSGRYFHGGLINAHAKTSCRNKNLSPQNNHPAERETLIFPFHHTRNFAYIKKTLVRDNGARGHCKSARRASESGRVDPRSPAPAAHDPDAIEIGRAHV